MKIEIRSDFWEETTHKEWVKRHERLLSNFTIFAILFILFGANFYIRLTLGSIMILIGFLALLSKNKHNKRSNLTK